MDIDSYLTARNESASHFSRRVSRFKDVSPGAIINIRNGNASPRIDTAQAIVRASEDQPAPCGGTIGWEDLIPKDMPTGNEAA